KSRGEAIPDLKWEIKELIVAGNEVIVRGEASGIPVAPLFDVQPTGKGFKIMSADIHTIEGGKIVRSYHIEDWAGAMRLPNRLSPLRSTSYPLHFAANQQSHARQEREAFPL